MKKIFFLLLLPIFCKGQLHIAGKYIVVDSDWANQFSGSISDDTANKYVFPNAMKTVAGRYVVDAVNYIYFNFPDSCTVIKLPNATDSLMPMQTGGGNNSTSTK